ncbi:unnamed protein product [Protopolystoma xenopodis]|uniref:Uncharacterized protein n=1 Tax=Protopolystoma xenopodis TaxID=117903 RepID=A0A448XE73_9PLAT|nr:unnamed protein product [Protopolystoma xenopodis]
MFKGDRNEVKNYLKRANQQQQVIYSSGTFLQPGRVYRSSSQGPQSCLSSGTSPQTQPSSLQSVISTHGSSGCSVRSYWFHHPSSFPQYEQGPEQIHFFILLLGYMGCVMKLWIYLDRIGAL